MRISDWSSDVCSSDLHYPVGKLQRLILIVGDEDGGDAGFVMDVPQPAAQVLSHLGVKRAERLVQQQQPRLHRKRARKRHAMPLTTRKLRRITLCKPRQLHENGRAHVRTPVTNANLVCRLMLEQTHI